MYQRKVQAYYVIRIRKFNLLNKTYVAFSWAHLNILFVLVCMVQVLSSMNPLRLLVMVVNFLFCKNILV